VWPYVEELFATSDAERRLAAAGVAVDPGDVREEFVGVLAQVLAAAGLSTPDVPAATGQSGRDGRHTEAMGLLLAELQVVARAHPMGRW
jgi:ring-1,2-phenylacetyl-CoA epoxidase subunit PaaC